MFSGGSASLTRLFSALIGFTEAARPGAAAVAVWWRCGGTGWWRHRAVALKHGLSPPTERFKAPAAGLAGAKPTYHRCLNTGPYNEHTEPAGTRTKQRTTTQRLQRLACSLAVTTCDYGVSTKLHRSRLTKRVLNDRVAKVCRAVA